MVHTLVDRFIRRSLHFDQQLPLGCGTKVPSAYDLPLGMANGVIFE